MISKAIRTLLIIININYNKNYKKDKKLNVLIVNSANNTDQRRHHCGHGRNSEHQGTDYSDQPGHQVLWDGSPHLCQGSHTITEFELFHCSVNRIMSGLEIISKQIN